MFYLDSCYIARLYLEDRGFEAVRELAATDAVACSAHGRAEVLAALHRQWREKALSTAAYRALLGQFDRDCGEHAFHWLPVSVAVIARVRDVFETLPVRAFLRAGDALHLASAAENSFRDIYSNDQRLLDAVSHFGLQGVDIIPAR